MDNQIVALVAEIDKTPFSEFWYGSKLLARASKCRDPRVVRILAIRHHHLQNKQAGSCQVLRQTIKELEGPYFNTLWGMIKCGEEDEKFAAIEILAEIGGVWSFQKFLNLLRDNVEKGDHGSTSLLLSGLGHNVARYFQISDESDPMGQVMDVKTGQQKTVSLRSIAPDVYERTMNDRRAANEYFALPARQRIAELSEVIGKIPDRHFPFSKAELLELIRGLAGPQ